MKRVEHVSRALGPREAGSAPACLADSQVASLARVDSETACVGRKSKLQSSFEMIRLTHRAEVPALGRGEGAEEGGARSDGRSVDLKTRGDDDRERCESSRGEEHRWESDAVGEVRGVVRERGSRGKLAVRGRAGMPRISTA